jgi:hypothetical protein
MTLVLLVAIVLYFVTSSDSASYVVDMMAANGVEEPPLVQKVAWCMTEGLAAVALLWAALDETGKAALNTVKPLPIVLGLPFTFVLFWVAQSALILCREETEELCVDRKNFSTFIFNFEVQSLVSFVAPFLPFGEIAAKAGWSRNKILPTVGFAVTWLAMIVFLALMAVDYVAFSSMGCALFFMNAGLVAGLRASVREELGISGDLISDCVACCFAFPFTFGQMMAEDFSKKGKAVSELKDPSQNSAGLLGRITGDDAPVTENKVTEENVQDKVTEDNKVPDEKPPADEKVFSQAV